MLLSHIDKWGNVLGNMSWLAYKSIKVIHGREAGYKPTPLFKLLTHYVQNPNAEHIQIGKVALMMLMWWKIMATVNLLIYLSLLKKHCEERDVVLFTAASQRLGQSLAHKTSITMSLYFNFRLITILYLFLMETFLLKFVFFYLLK